ncbi:FAD-binding oxidoreductase [Paracoccus sp. DMF-8]|uniref:NAD(P)/FAD-dependent oxidoreductase n=1 Tax=Paracoccus sp. DMF-8 TaxID=3019445 RepID=UPI0023E80601|nr:FAD-binding oxidoreductase [Paracoccus sp. DMF-8]MDF3606503.1 FAD-binding oxidoreductase [Paracoccus sp. DMF-8]
MSDIIIIGGGIAGVAAAAELSHQAKVTLIEAESALACHASGRSAALCEPFYGPAPVVELSLASGPGLAEAGVLSPRGVMLLAPAGEDRGFATEAESMRLQEIDIGQAVATVPILEPAALGRVAFGGHAQDIDTDLLIQSLARAARSRGADILTSAPASAIRRVAGAWQVTMPRGDIAAPVLVNAAGPWADRIATMAGIAPLGIVARRRSMARIAIPGEHDMRHWPMMLGLGESWYAKPDAGAMIVSPADADPVEPYDARAEDMTIAEGLARYAAMVRVPVQRLLATWAGLRSFAPDGVPLYGRDAAQPGFIWFAGQGGYGFQSSLGSARFLGDLLGGRGVDPHLARALDPARFAR